MSGISRRTAAIGVIVCILLALALRLCALSASLPCEVEPDGAVIPGQVALIQHGAHDLDEATIWRLYPHLIARLTALIPARVRHGDTLEEHLAEASAPFVHVRLVVALLSLLGIPATYWLARRFLPRGPALLAAFLSATSLLTLLLAQQARPHAPAAVFALLAVVAALRLARKPDWISCSLAGIALGLSIGVLQSGVAAALPVAAAWFWRDRERKGAAQRWLAPLWIALLAGGIAYTLYPHARPPPSGVAVPHSGFAGLVFLSGPPDPNDRSGVGHDVHLDQLDGSGFATVARSLISFETVPMLAAIVALLFGLRACLRRAQSKTTKRDLIVVGAYALPYFLVIGLYGRTCERFCLQLLPFEACLAAALWGRFSARAPRAFAIALLAVIALPQLGASLALERLRLLEDSLSQLGRWIESHVAPDKERVLFLPGVDVPLARTKDAIALDSSVGWSTAWVDYQRHHLDEGWECPRYALAYSPLLRAPDFAAALNDPLSAVTIAHASLVALIVPSFDHRGDFSTKLAAAFQKVLSATAKSECRLPLQAGEAANEPTPGRDIQVTDRIWTWELLSGMRTLSPSVEMYRLP